MFFGHAHLLSDSDSDSEDQMGLGLHVDTSDSGNRHHSPQHKSLIHNQQKK
jgi:hypothetical protein